MISSIFFLLISAAPVTVKPFFPPAASSLSSCKHALQILKERRNPTNPYAGFIASFKDILFEIPPNNLLEMAAAPRVMPEWSENSSRLQAIWNFLWTKAYRFLNPAERLSLEVAIQEQSKLVFEIQKPMTSFRARLPIGRASVSPNGNLLDLWLMTNPHGVGFSVTEGAIYDIFNRGDLSDPRSIQSIPYAYPGAEVSILPENPRVVVKRSQPPSLDILSVPGGDVVSVYDSDRLGIDVWQDSEISETGSFMIFRGRDDTVSGGVPLYEYIQLIDFRKRDIIRLAKYHHGYNPGLWFSFWGDSVVEIQVREDKGFDIHLNTLFRTKRVRHTIRSASYGSFSNFATDEIGRPVVATLSSNERKDVVDVYHLPLSPLSDGLFVEPTRKVQFKSNLLGATLSKDARWLAGYDESYRIHLYDLANNRFVPIPYVSSVSSFNFSPRSDRLLLIAQGVVHMINLSGW